MGKPYEEADGNIVRISSTAEFEHEVQVAGDVKVGPGVKVGEHSKLAWGVVLKDDATVGAFSQLGDNTHVLEGATLGYNVVNGINCVYGKGCTVKDGGRLDNRVRVGEGSTLESDVTVFEGVKIGKGCTVEHGAWVIRDLDDGETVKKHQIVYQLLGVRMTAWTCHPPL